MAAPTTAGVAGGQLQLGPERHGAGREDLAGFDEPLLDRLEPEEVDRLEALLRKILTRLELPEID